MFCEERALDHYLKLGFRCYRKRWKTPFAEIDLLLRAPDKTWVMVEVKSVTSLEYLQFRITSEQKTRLKRALLMCLEKDPKCRMELAVVSQSGDVQIFSDIFG